MFIIDDDAAMRVSIADLLESAGLASETFGTPQEFLPPPPRTGPGCIVLDLRLPGMDGLAVQRALADAGITMPIIFLTAFADVPTTVKAMKSGAVEFLTKPFDDQELLEAIYRALERDQVARDQQHELSTLQDRYTQADATRAPGHGARCLRAAQQTNRRRPRDERDYGEGPSPARHEEDAGGITGRTRQAGGPARAAALYQEITVF